MDTRLLEDALVLLEERNLSAAAARQHMTQPAFSRRIRALENWIGRELLIRKPNRVEFSPTLAESEPQIRAMLAHLQQLRSQLQNPAINSEPMVIATPHSLSADAVPEIVQKAKQGNADLVVRLRTQNSDTALSMFLRREADVLISYNARNQPKIPLDDSVRRYTWRRDALIPIVGGSLRYNIDENGLLKDGTNIISYPPTSYFGQIIANHQHSHPRTLSGHIAVESAFSVGIVQMVKLGLGAAWVPHSLIHNAIVSGETVILSSEYGRIPLNITIYIHKSNSKAVNFLEQLSIQ